MSILDWSLAEAPMVAVDTETTGFSPGADRVVELAVHRVPVRDEPAELLLETLVDPRRPIGATEVHGLFDADVADAPAFEDVAGDFLDAVRGSVLVCHNAGFDVRFLGFELRRLGVAFAVPYVCTMSLPRLLGLADARLRLTDLCRRLGVDLATAHSAVADCAAAAGVMAALRRHAGERAATTTFRALRDDGATARYLKSWDLPPLDHVADHLPRGGPRKPRSTAPASPRSTSYAEALLEVIADYQITPSEMTWLARLREEQGLRPEQVRSIHCTLYAWALQCAAADGLVDDAEEAHLREVHRCLADLGWAPGGVTSRTWV